MRRLEMIEDIKWYLVEVYLRCQRYMGCPVGSVVVEYRLPQSTTHQKKLHLCEFVTSEADESTNTHHLVSIVRVIGSRGGSLP